MQDWSKWSVIFSILHKFLLHLACFLEVNASLLAYWDINISLNDESQVVYQVILQLLCMLLWISVCKPLGVIVLLRWKWRRDCCSIKTRLAPYHVQGCHVLACMWFYHIQIHPCPFAGMWWGPSLPSLTHVLLYFVIFLSWGQAVACSYDSAKLDFTNKHLIFIGVPLTAIGEQFIFVSMDYLSDIYGESRKSCHNCKLIGPVIPLSISRSSPRSTLDTLSWWLTQNCYELDPLLL